MATPDIYNNSSLIFPNPVPVIGPEFCSSHPADLVMVKSSLTLSETKFVVTDSSGNLVFKVCRVPLSFHSTHMILDSSGKRLLTLRRKVFSTSGRWEAFRGDSKDKKDIIFSTKKSSLFQLHTNLDIFISNNNKNNISESEEKLACDYKLKGGWMSRSFTVYAAADNSNSAVAAQVEKKLTAKSVLLGKSKFEINVQQNVDYAFVVALVTIFDDIITRRRQASLNLSQA